MDGIDEKIMNGATESFCNVVSIKPNMKPNIKQAIFLMHYLNSVIWLLLYGIIVLYTAESLITTITTT